MWIFRWVFLPPPPYFFFLLHPSIPQRRIRSGRRLSYPFDPFSPRHRHAVGNCDPRTEIVGRSSSLPWTETQPRNDRIIPRPITPVPFFASILVYFLIATTTLLVGKRKGKRVPCNCCYYYYYFYYH